MVSPQLEVEYLQLTKRFLLDCLEKVVAVVKEGIVRLIHTVSEISLGLAKVLHRL